MLDQTTILNIAQEIIDALGLEPEMKANIIADLENCSNESIMEIVESLNQYYETKTMNERQSLSQMMSLTNAYEESMEIDDSQSTLAFI